MPVLFALFKLLYSSVLLIPLYDSPHPALSLYTSGSIAACQSLHFLPGYQIEVAGNSVLQCRSRHAVLQRCLEILAVQQTADHAACKGISAAHTVNDGMNAVLLGVVKLLGVPGVNTCGPAVVEAEWLTRREEMQYSKL